MARNLIARGPPGHASTTAHPGGPRGPRRAATPVADTVAEAVQGRRVALTMVTDDAAEEGLTFGPGGLLEHLAPGADPPLHEHHRRRRPPRRLAAAHEEARPGLRGRAGAGQPGAAAAHHLWVLAAGPEIQVNRCLAAPGAPGRGITRVGTQPGPGATP